MTALIVVAGILAYLSVGVLFARLVRGHIDDDPALASLAVLLWPMVVAFSVLAAAMWGLGRLVLKVLR